MIAREFAGKNTCVLFPPRSNRFAPGCNYLKPCISSLYQRHCNGYPRSASHRICRNVHSFSARRHHADRVRLPSVGIASRTPHPGSADGRCGESHRVLDDTRQLCADAIPSRRPGQSRDGKELEEGYSATPRLRGQTPSYLTTTINEFRDGKRGNSPGIADLLRAYSADDVKAMVAYLSSID